MFDAHFRPALTLKMIPHCCLVLLLAVTCVCAGPLYPWGEDNGDSPGHNYGCVYPIQMSKKIKFFRQSHRNISLCFNGRIGFEQFVQGLGPEDLDHGNASIAPFGIFQNVASHYGRPVFIWDDFMRYYYDDNFSKNLWYRKTNNRTLLQQTAHNVVDNFKSCQKSFKPKELFIATWSDIHDVDFCEYWDWSKEMCDCMVFDSWWRYFYLNGLEFDPSRRYCSCVTVDGHDPRFCECEVLFFESPMAHYYTGVYGPGIGYNETLCYCLEDNDMDMDFCDCEVYRNCPQTKQNQKTIARNKREDEETNTYQVVLITNGRHTYAMFNYEKISWIYSNTYGYPTWEYFKPPARTFAKVGFEKGNGKNYSHPYSGSKNLYKLVTDSNVGVPGRWLYRISGSKIQGPGCVNLPFDK